MAMTLEQARQAIVDRMMSFTGISQDRIQYQMHQVLLYQQKVCGVV